MPSLIYLIGCPTHVAVGTDLFEIAVSGLYGAATYSYKGRVELWAAFIMLIGAAVGAQIGAVATKYVKGYGIRIFFGFAVVGCDISVLMKIIAATHPGLKIGAGPLRDHFDSRPGVAAFAIHRDEVRDGCAGRAGPEESGGTGRVTGILHGHDIQDENRSAWLHRAALALAGCGKLGKVEQGRVDRL